MATFSNKDRVLLTEEINRQIRQSIAGSILFNQTVADRFGLRLTDTQCLNMLDLLGPVTPKRLAEYTGLTTGGVTVLLDRLERAGYIKREAHPSDRRRLLVRVNPRKLKAVHAMYAGIHKEMASIFNETSDAELQAVAKFLARMNAMRIKGPK